MRRLLNGPTGPKGLPGSQSVSKNRRFFLCVTLKFISCSLYEITVVGIFFFCLNRKKIQTVCDTCMGSSESR